MKALAKQFSYAPRGLKYKDRLKKEAEEQKKKDQMGFINAQFHDYKIKRIKEYQDNEIEGEMVKLASKQGLEEDR